MNNRKEILACDIPAGILTAAGGPFFLRLFTDFAAGAGFFFFFSSLFLSAILSV